LKRTIKIKFINPYFIIIFSLLIITSCSSTPLPHSRQIKIPDDFFGMVHAGSAKAPGEYELLDEMRVNWFLTTFYWSAIEKENGIFDFSAYDGFVEKACLERKKIIAVLGYESSWLRSRGVKNYIPPEDIPLFLRFVEETVNHFKDKIDVWEIWNEPNFMFWEGSQEEFFELSKLAALKIRKVDSNAYILGGVFWRTPRGFIKGMYKAGAMENLDGLAFHPYAVDPKGSMQIYDKFLDVLSEINYNGPVWITEVGYPTGGFFPLRVSIEDFPSYVVKTIAGAATRGARVLLWYQLYDSYNPEEIPRFTIDSSKFYGLVYPNLQKKNGAMAYELCAKYLPGSVYASDFPLKENIPSNIVSFCFLGGTSCDNTLIIWNDSNKTYKLKIQLQSPALLHDISNGNFVSIPNELNIGKKPVFITWSGNAIPKIFI